MGLKEMLSGVLGSEKYRDARARVDEWAERIRIGQKDAAVAVLREKNAYFSSMRKNSPGLYAFFEADDRSISRMGLRKITGEDVIID
jgi:hypothetical protein